MSKTETTPPVFEKPILRDAFFWLFLATLMFWSLVIYMLFY